MKRKFLTTKKITYYLRGHAYEYIPTVEKILEDKGLLQDSEGAKIVEVSGEVGN